MSEEARCYVRETGKLPELVLDGEIIAAGFDTIHEALAGGWELMIRTPHLLDRFSNIFDGQTGNVSSIVTSSSTFLDSPRMPEFWEITYRNEDDDYTFHIQPDLYVWKYHITPMEFLSKYSERLSAFIKDFGLQILDDEYWTYSVSNTVHRSIGETMLQINKLAIQVEAETIAALGLNDPPRSLNITFNFPEEVREACEQYLLYFSRFLKDAGQDVQTGVWPQGKQTLFSVIPDNQEQALEAIHEALQLYLSVPANVTWESPASTEGGFEMQRLMLEAMNLNNKYNLAMTELMSNRLLLQQKDKFIDQQQDLIQQLQQRSIIQDSVVVEVQEDTENLIPGVKLKEYDWGIFKFSPPEIFRKVKELFKPKLED